MKKRRNLKKCDWVKAGTRRLNRSFIRYKWCQDCGILKSEVYSIGTQKLKRTLIHEAGKEPVEDTQKAGRRKYGRKS